MMYDWLKDQKISRTMLYNILLLIKNNNNYIQFISLIPRIQYTLFRLVSDEEVLKKMRMQINIISDNKAVKEYILKLKLVMLFTRDKLGGTQYGKKRKRRDNYCWTTIM